MLSYVAKHSKLRKTTKVIILRLLHRFDVKTIKTFELGGKTTKVIKLQWIASIWRQNDQNNTKLQTNAIKLRSICIDLTSKHQNDQKCCVSSQNNQKTPKLKNPKTNMIKLQRIASIWYQKNQKNAKLRNYVAKHSKQRKTTKVIIL